MHLELFGYSIPCNFFCKPIEERIKQLEKKVEESRNKFKMLKEESKKKITCKFNSSFAVHS